MRGVAPSATWQSIRDEVLRRIAEREWAPGARIPHEAELANEFGCARATVNRALREVAEDGLIERRRRAGSRVVLNPARKATLRIRVVRTEVEARGATYRFLLLSRAVSSPPPPVAAQFNSAPGRQLLHVTGLHLADGRPYAFEDRWIDTTSVPEAEDADFSCVSPNEWLVSNVPYESGSITFSATPASPTEAETLDCAPGAALFTVTRATRRADATLTAVRLLFSEGYSMETNL